MANHPKRQENFAQKIISRLMCCQCCKLFLLFLLAVSSLRHMARPKKPPPQDSVAFRLQKAMEQTGHNSNTLGAASGVTPQTIRNILSGLDARTSTLGKLAKPLGVSAGWLAYGG